MAPAARLSGRTVNERLLARFKATPRHAAHFARKDGQWQRTSWRELGGQVAAFAAGLDQLGHKASEKIAILGDTRPEWTVCDLGAICAGAVSVGVYPTLTAEQTEYVIAHSDATTLVVQDQAQLDKILSIQSKLPKVKRIIVWNQVDRRQDDRIRFFQDVLAEGEKRLAAEPQFFESRAKKARPEYPAMIIYTSGTTGPPKGAVLSHGNCVFMMDVIEETMDATQEDVSFAFLPMAHVAEHVVGQLGRVQKGFGAYYAQSIQSVVDDLSQARPTVFGSVPRIFEKVYGRVQDGLRLAPPGKQKMARWAIETGVQAARLEREGKSVPLGLRFKRFLADRLVLSKVRRIFGGRVRFFISGAAPIAFEILEFFSAAGLVTYEVYGMTESTALITSNTPRANKLGTVGKPIPGCEVKIAEDGEILARGPNVFAGYFKEEAATKEAIDSGGWLHTGDIGVFDQDGYLRITDRKKNLIITAGGKNVAPANIENLLKQDPLISQVMVHGDKRKFLSALITLEPEAAAKFAKDKGLAAGDAKALVAHGALREHLQAHIGRCNAQLARYESIKRWEVLEEDFTVENNMLTPTLKVKRKQVEMRYQSLLDRFYQGGGGD